MEGRTAVEDNRTRHRIDVGGAGIVAHLEGCTVQVQITTDVVRREERDGFGTVGNLTVLHGDDQRSRERVRQYDGVQVVLTRREGGRGREQTG